MVENSPVILSEQSMILSDFRQYLQDDGKSARTVCPI